VPDLLPAGKSSEIRTALARREWMTDRDPGISMHMDGHSKLRRQVFSVLLLLLNCGLAIGEEADLLSASLDSITTDELKRHVNFLASDTLEGREAGTQGGYAAAAYIVQTLRQAGIRPASSDGDFYQTFAPNFRNILAVIPGGDPKLSDEYVLLGAHYDHVGYGTTFNSRGPIGVVHNGADDNASGTASVLEVAQALTLLKPAPRRSILIVLWDGEEKGLLGSRQYVVQPVVPVSKIRFHINADMIGRLRPRKFELYGWRTAPGLRQFIARQNTDGMDVDFTYEYRPDSDHWPFFERGVPSLMLHTGRHDDYHRPTDDVDRINLDGIRDISRLTLRLTVAAASHDELPPFRPAAREEASSLSRLLAAAASPPESPSRLGVNYDGTLSRDRIIRLTRIVPGGAAERGGLKVGDDILEFGGRRVADFPDFRTLVVTAASPVTVRVRRDGSEESLTLTLDGNPVVYGFSWRRDDAEPDSIVVTQVVPGSPADLSGLQPADRILLVDGRFPATDDGFRSILAEARAPLAVRLERRGSFVGIDLSRLLP